MSISRDFALFIRDMLMDDVVPELFRKRNREFWRGRIHQMSYDRKAKDGDDPLWCPKILNTERILFPDNCERFVSDCAALPPQRDVLVRADWECLMSLRDMRTLHVHYALSEDKSLLFTPATKKLREAYKDLIPADAIMLAVLNGSGDMRSRLVATLTMGEDGYTWHELGRCGRSRHPNDVATKVRIAALDALVPSLIASRKVMAPVSNSIVFRSVHRTRHTAELRCFRNVVQFCERQNNIPSAYR